MEQTKALEDVQSRAFSTLTFHTKKLAIRSVHLYAVVTCEIKLF